MTELPNQGSGFTTEEENEEFLRCLAEECCEVGQRVSKAQRFGLTQRQSGHDLDNAQRIVEELHDLISVAIVLEARGLLSSVLPTEDVVRTKRRKILRYMSVKRTGEDPAPRSPELEDPLPDDELEWHRNPTASKERAWVGYDPRTGRIARTSASPPSKAPKTFAASGPIAATENTYQGLREGTIGRNARLAESEEEKKRSAILADCPVEEPGEVERLTRDVDFWKGRLPSDGSCIRCGSVPRNADGLCATCVDEGMPLQTEVDPEWVARASVSIAQMVNERHFACSAPTHIPADLIARRLERFVPAAEAALAETRERLEKVEAARRAVQKLGALLSLKPHSFGQVQFDRYFEWVQQVEKAHADIRDALDRAALSTQESTR